MSLLSKMAKPFKMMFYHIKRMFSFLRRIIKSSAEYCYDASDYMVQHAIEAYRRFLLRFKAYREQHDRAYFYHLFRYFIYGFLAIMLCVILIGYYLFIVPVGSSAVITRFGKYSREVGSGLNFIFPIIERYYIVNSGNLFEESFGFRQGPPILSKEILHAQERFVTSKYEASILQSELDAESPFSERGDFLAEMKRRQRLTHDYIRRTMAPPIDKSSQAIRERIQKIEDLLSQDQTQEMDLSGRIPVPHEMMMLTSDLNLVMLQWTLQYHIVDTPNYLFNSRDVQENVRDIALAKMNAIIGESKFHEVITSARKDIEQKVIKEIQKQLDHYNVGIKIDQIIIINALPPKQVLFAFDEISKAAQDMERFSFQAKYEYASKIPEARGQAKRLLTEAQAYAIRTVRLARGEAGRFEQINQEYVKAPQITEDRLYITTMEALLKLTPNILLDKDSQGVLPLFLTNALGLTGQNQSVMPDLKSLGRSVEPSHNASSTPQATPHSTGTNQTQSVTATNKPKTTSQHVNTTTTAVPR